MRKAPRKSYPNVLQAAVLALAGADVHADGLLNQSWYWDSICSWHIPSWPPIFKWDGGANSHGYTESLWLAHSDDMCLADLLSLDPSIAITSCPENTEIEPLVRLALSKSCVAKVCHQRAPHSPECGFTGDLSDSFVARASNFYGFQVKFFQI